LAAIGWGRNFQTTCLAGFLQHESQLHKYGFPMMDRTVQLVSIASALAVFLADAYIPLGIAVGALYCLVVVLSSTSNSQSGTFYISLICSILLMVGTILSPSADVPPVLVFVNRFIYFVLIWICAGLIVRNQQARHALLQRTEQHKDATEAKSRFLASMSHEIRTPMNAVLGLAQLLQQESLAEEPMKMVKQINDAGQALIGIINDILDFSKSEAGQLELQHQAFSLDESLRRVESLLVETARQKNLVLRIDAPSLEGRFIGDSLRLEQVLINLTGNAIKFTDRGEVLIRVLPLEIHESIVRLRYEVKDTGIGLSPEASNKLFQPYVQAHVGIARRFGGTGLGLAISKRLVELMRGEIGVESTQGLGSTFWFELTLERCKNEAPTESHDKPQHKGPQLEGLSVLVADDNQINLFLAERALQKEGAKVTLVKDGQQVLEHLRAAPGAYDLILMDIQMPVMDGLEATTAIRQELHLVDLPVIALSAGVLADERHQALAAGINAFLPKPLDLMQMTETIRKYCPVSSQSDVV
jgi:signal transduction histidine kinase/CheY-like chemotaxis protein